METPEHGPDRRADDPLSSEAGRLQRALAPLRNDR
jgi:hypothetical protein